MIHRVKREIGGKEIQLETGLLAKQAAGSVVASCGGTKVMAAATWNPEASPDQDFFPLTVDYREMTYASGKIPGSFFRREGRPSEREVLCSRLIDRPLRPQFPDGFFNDVNIMLLAISFDQENESDVLAQVAAAAALAVSDIPMKRTIGSIRVGLVAGELVANPLKAEQEKADMDLLLSGSKDGICMVEAGAAQVPEDKVLDGIEFGHKMICEVVELIEELAAAGGKAKAEIKEPETPSFYDDMIAKYEDELSEAARNADKIERRDAIKAVRNKVLEEFVDEEAKITDRMVKSAFEDFQNDLMRKLTLTQSRCDGRGFDDVRNISIELDYLPNSHGSVVFTRGETQALASCTLGTLSDEILIDGLLDTYRDDFMLHYNFPPFCVGETWPYRGPRRREIGHGALARRALRPILPEDENFPYTIRVVSDILESNGSSSMATVCGGSLAMMDAGVPTKAAVAGIAMGLLKDGDEYHVLTDILGDEDHFGDMDFKVAGTRDGITALQMDIKITNIPTDVMKMALEKAHTARMHVLDKMDEVLAEPRPEISANAPQITMVQIPVDMIGKVIGPGGKVIRAIQEDTGATVEIDDDGKVTISAVGPEKLEAAKQRVKELTFVPEEGATYDGTVTSVRDFGAFVEIAPGVEGLLHVSEITDAFVKDTNSVVNAGDKIRVKVLSVDAGTGKMRLSRKAVIETEGGEDVLTERLKNVETGEPRQRGGDSGRGGRGGGRGGDRRGGGGRGGQGGGRRR